MKYVVQNYAASSCTIDAAPKEVGTLELARKEVKKRLGVAMLRGERLVEREGALEAYRVLGGRGAAVPSLGGVEIVKVTKKQGLLSKREEERLAKNERKLAAHQSPPSRQRSATKRARGDEARPEGQDREKVLDAVTGADRRERASGRWTGSALLSVREVRKLVKLPKERFDVAMVALARDGVVSLHRHDHPAGLPAEERELLVRDAKGNHFNGVSLREVTSFVPERPALEPKRVIDAIKKVRTGSHGRARLADLKRELGSPDHAEFSRALLALQEAGRVVLMRNDNNAALKVDDDEAAVWIAGNPRHLVFLQ